MAPLDLKANTDRLLVGLLVLAAALAAAVFFWPTEEDSGGGDSTGTAASSQLGRCKGEDRLMIPSQKLTAKLIDIQTKQTERGIELDPPADPDVVGWWDRSARPGFAEGQTLITGHTVHDGAGALNNIGALKKGKPIKVCSDGLLVTYRTTKVFELTKEQLAQRTVQLYSQRKRTDGRLVLVTCTDWVGPGNYRSNLIVFGQPVATA